MTMVNVQFSDDTQATIVAYFASPQDSDFYQNMGAVETSDPRWKTYYDFQSDYLQQYLPRPSE
jgi:hypothetical protein